MRTDLRDQRDGPAEQERPDDAVIVEASCWALAVTFLAAGFILIALGRDPWPRIMGFIVACSASASIAMLAVGGDQR